MSRSLWSMEFRIGAAGFAGAIALSILSLFLLLSGVRQFDTAAKGVTHIHEVLTECALALSTLQAADLESRGYDTTGDRAYSEAFSRDKAAFLLQVRRIASLTADNPLQQKRIPALKQAIQRISIKPGEPQTDYAAAIRKQQRELDGDRAIFNQLEAEEWRLLRERNRNMTSTGTQLCTLIGVIACLGVFSFGMVFLVARRLRLLDGQLRSKNAQLEAHSAEVQHATLMKSRFVANMSHELRTPLNGIIGFTELMYDGISGEVSPTHKEFLADILTSARHLVGLINDMLDLAKVEEGRMEFRPEVANLETLIREVRDSLHAQSQQKQIRVDVEIAAHNVALLDSGKFKQVLYNYLSNALKFTPSHGTVTIRLLPEGGDWFRLTVEDTGPGIKPEDLARLFVEFQQLEMGAERAYGGTGLGLALTRRLVEAQGGRVEVHSQIGEGSKFSAVLPRVPRLHDPVSNIKRLLTSPSAGAKILVIEDDARDRAFLAQSLKRAGYETLAVSTTAEAVRLTRDQVFDGIVVDVLTAGSKDLSLIAGIQSGLNHTTPVVSVSMVAESGCGDGRLDRGMVKSVEIQKLRCTLDEAGIQPDPKSLILVVDDDLQSLRLMETTLDSLGYHAVCVNDTKTALQVASDRLPSAIILDLLMPGMTGLEFLASFRKMTSAEVPVIVWTGADLSFAEKTDIGHLCQAVTLKRDGMRSVMENLSASLENAGKAAAGSPVDSVAGRR